ncbi:MAG TPA: transcription elongation factor GreA, partial [Candidatus Dormibacteraeota bacterium]|nr:transcription elongation factor GreA [Candidatus Dormibacteraeota bacterium]
MDDKPVLLTTSGLHKLELEHERLTSTGRDEVAERIRVSRDFGDINENAEYIEAKNDQSLLEGRIQALEHMIRNAVIIEGVERTAGIVEIGASVSVSSEEGEEKYDIVGPAEADPMAGRISNESPLGRALLGHRPGDEVHWDSP